MKSRFYSTTKKMMIYFKLLAIPLLALLMSLQNAKAILLRMAFYYAYDKIH
jgi:hypothetical protein